MRNSILFKSFYTQNNEFEIDNFRNLNNKGNAKDSLLQFENDISMNKFKNKEKAKDFYSNKKILTKIQNINNKEENEINKNNLHRNHYCILEKISILILFY